MYVNTKILECFICQISLTRTHTSLLYKQIKGWSYIEVLRPQNTKQWVLPRTGEYRFIPASIPTGWRNSYLLLPLPPTPQWTDHTHNPHPLPYSNHRIHPSRLPLGPEVPPVDPPTGLRYKNLGIPYLWVCGPGVRGLGLVGAISSRFYPLSVSIGVSPTSLIRRHSWIRTDR